MIGTSLGYYGTLGLASAQLRSERVLQLATADPLTHSFPDEIANETPGLLSPFFGATIRRDGANEGALPPTAAHKAADLELPVRLCYRGGVHPQLGCKLPHGRQYGPWLCLAGSDERPHALRDLLVQWSRAARVEFFEHRSS
ncbi:MAG: hypothetical protein ACI9OJ_003749 [Myxococcota bacterium]|jgi:hypothetical protein